MIVTFHAIFKAYKQCKKNKANTISAIKFELHLIDNLWELYHEINSGCYVPSSYICFIVQSPKMREVFASDFRDRVVHHLLFNDLEPLFEPIFIYDSYSCRENKGTHKAVARVQQFSRKEQNSHYMQLDIKNYFLSINKTILFNRIDEIVLKKGSMHSQRILFLAKKIIFDNPASKFTFKGDFSQHKNIPPHKTLLHTNPSKGLPIGNLTSQFFANVYLDIMDNYIKRVLKVKHYVRYVDDFVLFGSSKEELLFLKLDIEEFIDKRLHLRLREDYKIKKVESGIDFLGYIIRPRYKLVRKRVVNNYRAKKALFFEKAFKDRNYCTKEERDEFKAITASYYGHFKHASSFRLIEKLKMEDWR